ncbi:MAG: hypothetical protein HYX62_02535 [Gammaproteobacteria bacterium]|nr:hypothetical protein [Gammaproteobacteria bacterium]
MYRKETLSITQLDLDVSNPRTNPEDNQTEAMQSLLSVEHDGEKVLALAFDICEIGMLDPGDRLYVIASKYESNRYIVLDGNRRLTALRLLSQPGLLDRDDIGLNTAMRQRFKRLQTEFPNKWPSEADVVIFDDRETAKRFIRLRHAGENDGAGRSAWSALQVARFDHTGLWQCVEQLRQAQVLNLDVINELDRSAFKITNFERVVGKVQFQQRFGFTLGPKKFEIGADRQRALQALSKVASDVVSGHVHTRDEFAKAESMSNYFNEVEAAISPVTAQPSTPTEASLEPAKHDTDQSAPKPTGSSSAAQAGSRASQQYTMPNEASETAPVIARKKRTLKYLIDKRDLQTVTNAKCREIVIELKEGVEVQRAPYACALLLRSLQEMTAELYLTAMQQKVGNKTTNIDQAANHLLGSSHPTDPANKTVLATSFKSSGQIYEQLCQTAHNTNSAISQDHVRTTWRNLSGGMDLLWKRIYAASQPIVLQQSNPLK